MEPKVSEPASSEGSPEPTQTGALSPNERALFDNLFIALDSLVLERSAERHAFRPIHTMPDWAQYLIAKESGQPGHDFWIIKSHFLEFYMQEANQWWDQHEGGVSDSMPWEEDGPSEATLDFEVEAAAIGSQKLLVIRRLHPSVRAYTQLMRAKRFNPLRRSPEL